MLNSRCRQAGCAELRGAYQWTRFRRSVLAGLLIILIGLPGLLSGCTEPQSGSAPAATPTPAPDKEVGPFDLIRGTDYLRAPIVRAPRASGGGLSSSGYTPSTTHNFVFVDRRDETIQQLLPTNDAVIIFNTGLPEAAAPVASGTTSIDAATDPAHGNGPPIQWFLYSIVPTDTNNDGRFSQDDLQTLALSDVDGTGYTPVITDVATIHGYTLTDRQTLLVIYRQGRQGGKLRLARIDLPTRAIITTTAFPPLGADVR